MNTSLRLSLAAFFVAGLSGCVVLGAIQAVEFIGITARVVGKIAEKVTAPPTEKDRCAGFAAKGIAVTEPLAIAIPTDEGEVRTFEATIWRSELENERYPQRERREPVIAEGTLAITERAILLVPPLGTAGVRIPYEVLLTVELSPINPYSMTVGSCTGRFDVFNFWQRQPNQRDPEAAAAAAEKLKYRVAAFQATKLNATDTPH